jgi:isopentenyl diphosphate isomerase/L-lactate dehydrogenase-like FMN-dependent dehydrogenase
MPAFDLERHSRRRFLQFLAASPLVATSSSNAYAADAPSAAGKYPDPMIWAPFNPQDLITSPKDAINVFDFEPVARNTVPPAHFGYMASGIDSETTLRANREAFAKYYLRPRRLIDVSHMETSIELYGVKWETPIILAPVGGNRSFHETGETGVALAAKARKHLHILSTVSSTSVEEVIKAREGPVWFQLYATPSFDVAKALVKRAEAAGCPVLAITADRLGGRNQETFFRLRRTDTRECSACHVPGVQGRLSTRPNFEGIDISGLKAQESSNLTWDTVRRLKDATRMKVIIKGILTAEDAKLCVDNGLDGLIVSNHGGRGEDNGRGALDCLPEVVDAVGGRIPVLVDGGFRRGTDIVKALALGAQAVCIGRPYLWGLGAFGQAGVERVLELLRAELQAAMQQCGVPSVKDITPALVRKV